MDDTRILLAHGNGGRLMRELIADTFARHLGNPLLDTDADAVAVPQLDGEVMLTTDGFTVQPLEFPGGNLGSLAVHGVVNDLAVAGADPRYFTLSALIEEGLEVEVLDRLIASFAAAARENGVAVVAGDTKVVRRGEGGGLYLSVAGIGVRRATAPLDITRIAPGAAVLVSGPVGDHGIAVMLAREQFGLSGELRSDSASVLPLARAVRDLPGLKFMRDRARLRPQRGARAERGAAAPAGRVGVRDAGLRPLLPRLRRTHRRGGRRGCCGGSPRALPGAAAGRGRVHHRPHRSRRRARHSGDGSRRPPHPRRTGRRSAAADLLRDGGRPIRYN